MKLCAVWCRVFFDLVDIYAKNINLFDFANTFYFIVLRRNEKTANLCSA
jgi:hypothetical protein